MQMGGNACPHVLDVQLLKQTLWPCYCSHKRDDGINKCFVRIASGGRVVGCSRLLFLPLLCCLQEASELAKTVLSTRVGNF